VHFGAGAHLPVAAGAPVDATFRLERNEWRGVVEPRLLLREARSCDPGPIVVLGEGGSYLERAFAELGVPLETGRRAGDASTRLVCDRRGRGVAATISGLVHSGEPVLVVTADAPARLRHLRDRLGGFGLCSHAALARLPLLARDYAHIVILDPPTSADEQAQAVAGGHAECAHLAWGEPELRFAAHIHQREFGLRACLADLYRVLRDSDGASGEGLETALRGDVAAPRSPELAGRMLRVFVELGLVELDPERQSAGVVLGGRVELETSPAFCHYQRRLEDGQRYLGKNAAAPSGERRAA
jgi:single-stranded-DNA-specific exonuclease